MDRVRYWPTALALGGFLAASYALCVAWDGLFPSWAMRSVWEDLLPGFEWLSVGSFFLGLAETFVYGLWLALLMPALRWTLRAAAPAATRGAR